MEKKCLGQKYVMLRSGYLIDLHFHPFNCFQMFSVLLREYSLEVDWLGVGTGHPGKHQFYCRITEFS